MKFESFDPDAVPAARVSKNPNENKHQDYLVQAKLMTRSPLPPGEWSEKYAKTFRHLYETDEFFRERILHGTDEDLNGIQTYLDSHVQL